MAVQNPFFGKRETESFQPRQPASVLGGGSAGAGNASSTTAASPLGSSKPVATAGAATANAVADGVGSKLTVGPNIKLKGVEITDCDTLVVEGTVEATMDSRVIQIAEQGAFRGSAEIDIAEIHGEFDGTLTVRQKLVIYSTGKVNGKIRYGKVVIEEGGQLAGEIESGTTGAARSHSAANLSRSEAQPLAA
ncbi:bactofilin family protein [Paracidovorax anthurii]|uniref:Cytoskeletal protein CcmA (Bactofilin family) n=1 Tax=Paracidovorax anthurii TaxID=78229 RepID=A0A328Z6J5_9BURK|nr:polymer-forming cytoskeletal protein [Paracidovorax anthurii]RAR81364.1 cytoskeletal protein CcmA (bactofilin family) [Paracidovorax anthurii]